MKRIDNYDRKNYTAVAFAPLPRYIHTLKEIPELGFHCDQCGAHVIETEIGIVKGCEHHTPDLAADPQIEIATKLVAEFRTQIRSNRLMASHPLSVMAGILEIRITAFYTRPLGYDCLDMALQIKLAKAEWDAYAFSRGLPLSRQLGEKQTIKLGQ